VPMKQSRVDAGTFRQASVMTGANPVSPSRESFRPSDRAVNTSALPSRANSNPRFFSTNTNGNAHQNTSVQGERGAANFNRGVNSANTNSVNRLGNPRQQNSGRLGPQGPSQTAHSFGEANSGNVNRVNRGPSAQPPSQGPRSIQSSRPGWHTFTPPSGQQAQPNGGRAVEGRGATQSRPNFSQPSQPQRPVQNNPRGNASNNGYNRPTLDMRQPVVTPRGGYNGGNNGGYHGAPSAPPVRSAPSGGGGGYRGPSGGGYSAPAMRAPSGGGGGYRGPSGGGPRGGYSRGGYSGGGHSEGGSRGGSSGGGNSGGRNRR
jgi:hypothetical protein